MHTQETKNQFIELRANGHSFDTIAEKLNVSKQTLLRWARDFDSEIRSLRAVQLAALYDKIFASHELEAKRMAKIQTNIEASLGERNWTVGIGKMELLKASSIIRKEIREFRKHSVDAFRPSPTSPQPGAEDQAITETQTPPPQSSAAPTTHTSAVKD